MRPRIVVTGTGVISSIGAGSAEFLSSLDSGRLGFSDSTLFEGLNGSRPRVAEITDFTPQNWLGRKGLRVMSRSARLLAVATSMALEAYDRGSGSSEDKSAQPEIGLACGTVFGSVQSIVDFDWSGLTDGRRFVNPSHFPNTVINSPAGHAAIKHRLVGLNATISTGLTSGLYAIHYAAQSLTLGRARALIAGGVEESCQESYLGFFKSGILSTGGRPRPFEKDRDGTVPGEGAGVWLLETEESARSREAAPIAEVLGFGSAFDAGAPHEYNVAGEGASQAMLTALSNSGLRPEDVSIIIASANGSRAGDATEVNALKRVFGGRLGEIPICAPKASFGESMGASGALLSITAGHALQTQSVPPTAGATAGELAISPESVPFTGRIALVNSFGCDGHNAALVVRRWADS